MVNNMLNIKLVNFFSATMSCNRNLCMIISVKEIIYNLPLHPHNDANLYDNIPVKSKDSRH